MKVYMLLRCHEKSLERCFIGNCPLKANQRNGKIDVNVFEGGGWIDG